MSRPEHQFDVEIVRRRAEDGSEWHANIEGVGRVVGYSLEGAKEDAREFIAASREIDYNDLDLTFKVGAQDRLWDTAGRVLRSRGYDKHADSWDLWEDTLEELSEALAQEVGA